MAEANDLVLSEIHLYRVKNSPEKESELLQGREILLTGFKIKCPGKFFHKTTERSVKRNTGCLQDTKEELELDDDGDIVVPRRTEPPKVTDNDTKNVTLKIHHSMATPLDDVGLQVWMGSLIMIDYIMDRSEEFVGKRILELGGGVGLTSIVLGMTAESVLLTDVGDHVLHLCERNYLENADLLCCDVDSFRIAELDWFKSDKQLELINPFSYCVIVACDVIYDNDITNAFFRTLYLILQGDSPKPRDRTVYISLEKRLNFTVTDLDVTCKEYDHFQDCLEQLRSLIPSVNVTKVDMTEISQYCEYTRTPQLEIWKLQIVLE